MLYITDLVLHKVVIPTHGHLLFVVITRIGELISDWSVLTIVTWGDILILTKDHRRVHISSQSQLAFEDSSLLLYELCIFFHSLVDRIDIARLFEKVGIDRL